MDVVVPSASELLSDFVRENTVFVILLLVVLLAIAASMVNICVLRKNRKTPPTEKDSTSADDK